MTSLKAGNRDMTKRVVDLILASCLLVVAAVPMLCIALAVRLTSSGSVLYWSDRMARDHRLFKMPKFRTMRPTAPEVAADLLVQPERWLTPIGGWLRRNSLDELPQLWSVVKGDMSLVGPRPALHSQHELLARRAALGLDALTPGLTGWAQINGRDTLTLAERIELDRYYLHHRSVWFDLQILGITLVKVLLHEGTEVPAHLLRYSSEANKAA
jgi:O-antigen biosynthesis protein WbqP